MRLGNPEKALADRAHLPFERNASGMACALAILGNREEYLAQTGALLKDIDPASLNATDSNNTAWACVLMPGATPDPEKVVALARTGAAGAQGDELPNYLNTLGIALYRTGRDAEAVQVLARAEAISENPYNRVFLAMAHHRLGHKEVSLGYAKAFRTHMDESFGRTEAARHEKVLFLRELNSTMPPTPELAKPESPRPTKLAR